MKVLVIGAAGQVGRALLARAPHGSSVQGFSHAQLDIGDESDVARAIGLAEPSLVINAAAYTAVDKAESEPELAHRINADGPRFLARAAARAKARFIHISTDFVFDGSASRPYSPDAPTHPLNVYGVSKRQGELEVLEVLDSAVVLRTAWVYAAEGRNFMNTMLRLMKANGAVRVVSDQVGTPTAASSIADAIWRIADAPAVRGIHHWTDDGSASWFDFAIEIARLGAVRGLVPAGVTVTPIGTADYPTPARRPRYSVLDKQSLSGLAISSMPWQERLRGVMQEVPHG